MKTFITRVVIFALIIIVIFICLEKVLSKFDEHEYKYKHDYLVNHLNDIKILALGHSHIAVGIDMIFLNDSGFNAAIPSRNIYYDAEIVKEFVPKMSNLKTIILPLGYNFQYKNEISEKDKYLMFKYWGYNTSGVNFLLNSELLYGSKSKLKRLIFPQKVSEIYFDSLGQQHLPQELNKYYRYEINDLSLFRPKDKNNIQFIKKIKEIASICKDNDIRLIVLMMPCYKTYTELTTTEGISELYSLVDSIRSIYPSIEYYDFMKDSRFVMNDFFDSSHLNEVGARKFTTILKNEILPNN